MNQEILILDEQKISNKIYSIRGLQVMLDNDLALLYGVEVKVFNQAVKRNIKRFPKEFRFQLTENEFISLRSQFVTLKNKRGEHRKYLPYVFTEQGVSMLSAVLKSQTAIDISIKIINSFVEMRKIINNNYMLFQRVEKLEEFKNNANNKFENIFKAIESKELKPEKGIFYNGQVFDAYNFISDLIKSAKSSIIIIDNFIDETVLTLLTKRKKGCKAIIYTDSISKTLKLDLMKYNRQYPLIEIKVFKKSHDRFLILDRKEVYLFGASLKDLGKKIFGFAKMGKENLKILERIEGN